MKNYELKHFKEYNDINYEYLYFLYTHHTKEYKKRFDSVLRIAFQKCKSDYNLAILTYINEYQESFFYHCINEPSFIFWINGLEDLLLDYRNIEPNTNFTKSCLNELDISNEEHIDFFIAQANKFIASHASKYNKIFSYPIEIMSNWIPGQDYFYPNLKYLKINKIKNGKVISNQDLEGNKQLVPFFILNDNSTRFQIHNFDIFFNFDSIERWRKISDINVLQRSSIKIKECLLLIERIFPGFNNQVELLIKHFIPISTDGIIETQSGTYSGLFGSIYLTYTENPFFLAEMIIHEFCHHKLFLLEEVHPLFDDENYSHVHYSPLRNELRTQQGVFHALYVTSEILKFWSRAFVSIKDEKLKEIAHRRIWTTIYQIKYGSIDLMQLSKLSQAGKDILNVIHTEALDLEKKFLKIDESSKPFYTELKINMNLWNLPILESILVHRKETWAKADSKFNKPNNL